MMDAEEMEEGENPKMQEFERNSAVTIKTRNKLKKPSWFIDMITATCASSSAIY
jgi:hypothetical protein